VAHNSIIRYIGGKTRMATRIAKHLRGTGGTCLVEVFGGSAAVMLSAGFEKRVYNDLDGDIVNLFMVLASRSTRQDFIRKIRWTPPSREIFEKQRDIYVGGGFSFASIKCPIDRAIATFYRQAFAFGGKIRNGGFQVSTDHTRDHIKELHRFRIKLRELHYFGEFFRNTVLEQLDYRKCISVYGKIPGVVFFVDPPYPKLQPYYSVPFSEQDHVVLSWLLQEVKAPVVCTFYDNEVVRDLYPESKWEYYIFNNTKNAANSLVGRKKQKVNEVILVRK